VGDPRAPFDEELPPFFEAWLAAQGWRPANALRAGWDPARRRGMPTAAEIGAAHRALLAPDVPAALVTRNGYAKRAIGAEVRALRPCLVLDVAGVYLPRIGSPLCVLVCDPMGAQCTRIVGGLRGEPRTPPTPEQGEAWQELVAHFQEPAGWRGTYFTVVEQPTDRWWLPFTDPYWSEVRCG
jgi:hypothetical protein